MLHTDLAWEEGARQSAKKILISGSELLPVIFVKTTHELQCFMLAVPKTQWRDMVKIILAHLREEESEIEGILLLSSVFHRTLEKGEPFTVRPSEDPKAQEGAICYVLYPGGYESTWLINYESSSKEAPMELGEWEEIADIKNGKNILSGLL